MTTYKLKDTYEQLLERKLTQQILYILQSSDKKKLTRKEIYQLGKKRYENSFKSDTKGIRILRYLNTMHEYSLVKPTSQGKGKPSLWEKIEQSEELNFNIKVKDQINHIKNLTDPSKHVYHPRLTTIMKEGVTAYNVRCLKWASDEEKKKIESFIEGIQRDLYFYLMYHEKIMGKVMEDKIKHIYDDKKCSWEDKQIATIFITSLLKGYQNFEFAYELEDKLGIPIQFKWFKKDKDGFAVFPFVLKMDFELLRILSEKLLVFNDKKKIWNIFNCYNLSKRMSNHLLELMDIDMDKIVSLPSFTIVCEFGEYMKKLNKEYDEEYSDSKKEKKNWDDLLIDLYDKYN